jgi:hypothetical protein
LTDATFHQLLLACDRDLADTARGAWCKRCNGVCSPGAADSRQAADCHRNVIAFIRGHPDDYEPGFEEVFVKLADRPDPPTET